MYLREAAEAREEVLCTQAARSKDANDSRTRFEEPCAVRTAFQRDCHRIVHSKAFRRLRGKTQVFLWPKGDHYRTRLTHCMEVSQIARTISRALWLNEDLTEAIALGHDLGHTPFGHAGEGALQKLHPQGFRHERQSLKVVESLENDGRGLNLTEEVKDGILNHSKGAGPLLDVPADSLPRTLEGQVVRISDLIAYINHDLDDAIRAKVLTPEQLPPSGKYLVDHDRSGRLTKMIKDVIQSTDLSRTSRILLSDEMAGILEEMRAFLYENVYYNDTVHCEFKKATRLIEQLWEFFLGDLDLFYRDFWPEHLRNGSAENDVLNYIAGMTDSFAISQFRKYFSPRRWDIY